MTQRKVAWLTGASRGMGADTALHLARAGYDVAITARDQERLDGIAAEVARLGRECLAKASDLTDRMSMMSFADAALDRFGHCNVLCNIGINKGPSLEKRVADTTLDELVEDFEADVVAPVLLAQKALPSMRERGGTIINMVSAVVALVPPGTAENNGWSFSYAGAKAALDQLAKLLNIEVDTSMVRTFSVEPGFVASGEVLAAKLRQYPGIAVSPPEAIGPAILWLVESPDAERLLTKRVNLPTLTDRHSLLADWDGPGTVYQRS